jgi:TonB-dependent receptor
MTKFALLSLLLLLGSVAISQKASIFGKVLDGTTGESIPGVKVVLEGKGQGGISDPDGNYLIEEIEPGTYNLVLSYVGFNTKIVTDVEVTNNQKKEVNVTLDKIVKEIGGVTVRVKVNKESESALIQMKKNAITVMDGVSSESIKKTPDKTASDVLKRVSGASIQDNKFVVVRGLSDRYNFALINGLSLPSSESDRKAFSFDIFPSIMMDNLVIYKTATPEMPGEFAGGVIDINTTEPKEKDIHSIQLAGSVNTITTFRSFETYESSSMDILGLGSSSRALPDLLPETSAFSSLTKDEKGELAKLMNFSWSGKTKLALPGTSLQYSIGKNLVLNKEKERSLGFVFAYAYQNNYTFAKITRREFEEQADAVVLKMELEDSAYTQNVMNSAMLNLAFNINKKNRIQFKNMYSINSDDRFNVRQGVREFDNDTRQFERSNNIWYTQNNLYTGQLFGKHDLNVVKVNWNAGYSNVQRDIPNLRRVVYRKYATTEEDSTQQYVAIIQNNGTIPTAAGNMFWSTSTEHIVNGRYDVAKTFELGKTKHEFKLGGFHQLRWRDFAARNFGFSQYKPTGSSFNSQLLLLPEDSIFQVSNLGMLENGQGGFKLEEASSVDDSYQASSMLNAGFIMGNSELHEKLRLVYGARFESYNQQFNYVEFGSNLQRNLDTTTNDLLPSVNLIYSPTKKVNIRLAYFKTVSRPEFRELAPFAFYNFLQDNILSGNPNLQRANINNYDVRFEWFPGKNQIISVSGFYKEFLNPIELINRTGTSGAPELYYTNVPKAVNYGGELEYKLNFGFLAKDDSAEVNLWSGLNAGANFSLIRSRVELSQIAGSGDDRPLQGQSPYIANASLSYAHPVKDWSVTASYNIVGQRIYIVGNVQEPSVWENGRHVIDLQLAKTFADRLEIKLNVKDLLAQDLVFFQDLNGNRKFDNEKNTNVQGFDPNQPTLNDKFNIGPDNVWQEIQFGQSISLSVKYNFGVEKKK